jgi:hypothetical protein
MKIHLVAWVLCTAALAPHAVKAAALDAQQLGGVTAVFNFCSKVDPRLDRQLDQKARLFVAGMPKNTLEAERNSAAYLSAYQTLQSVLAELSEPDALRACQAIAAS